MEGFDSFTHNLFQSIHGAISKDALKPMSQVGTELTLKNLTDAGIDINHCYFNEKGFVDRYIYWEGPVFLTFHSLDAQFLEMFKPGTQIARMKERMESLIKSNKWESVFSFMDKKVLIPMFKELFDQIPDSQKYGIFADLYVRSEFGFEMFGDDFLKQVFKYKNLDPDYPRRMQQFAEDAKVNTNPDGTITIYHGKAGDYNVNDEMSWTLQKKTASFFANRFQGKGKIISKKIKPEQVADYFDSRGEAETIILPKRLR